MEHSPLFLKLRLAMFSLTTLICFIWVILLSCVLFLRWQVSSLPERSFLFIFLGIDTLTVTMLPVLLLVKFRTWLDAARLLLLLVCHIGIAASFVIWYPTIPCPNDSEFSCYPGGIFLLTDVQAPDDRGVCQLINVYIIMASWVPPLLLILYGVGLATYTWRYASRPQGPLLADEEIRRVQPNSRDEGYEPVTEPMDYSSTRHLSGLLTTSLPSTGTSVRDSHREPARKSRLEKRIPEHFL